MAREGFWPALTLFDSTHLAPTMALRNAIGMALCLGAGLAAGDPAAGVMAATGALDVAFSDGADSYRFRARRMLAAAVFVALAVFAGRLWGHNHLLAMTIQAACALMVGLLVALGQTPADIGTITLVTLIVFAASPAPFGRAISSGLLALAGGILQTAISLAFWPVRRYGPESAAVSALYDELARSAAQDAPATASPPATEPAIAARTALGNLAGDHSIEAERYLALFSQAERIRLSLLTLHRLRTRLSREPAGEADAAFLTRCLHLAADALKNRGQTERSPVFDPRALHVHLPAAPSSTVAAMRADALSQLDALAGQLRATHELTGHTTPSGLNEFARSEAAKPWRLRVAGSLAVLRANFSLNSAAFRHAVRLAACVAAADLIASSLGWRRHYWAPMTVAIVLKPDFTSTYSRGLLRLAGTFAGLAIATALFHYLPLPLAGQAAFTTGFFFLMRWAGGANYGVLVTALTALVVFLFTLGGTPPGDVMAARALNTVAGGLIALVAYGLWPTWERTRISDSLAALLDAYREYFQTVRDGYLQPGLERDQQFAARLSRVRHAGRIARTNLEASAARLGIEPGVDHARITAFEIILANSHRFIHAAMALESGLFRSRAVPARGTFRDFANAVDATLYFLSAYLRGSPPAPDDLPDLRAAHNALIQTGDDRVERYALVNVETDRVANSVNSLAVEILHWIGSST